ncbi:MAG: AI-2E family transporter [Acidobacteriota bacterium]
MTADREFSHRLLQTVTAVAAAITLVAAVYAARGALMLVYISALISMGFSPVVSLIQHPGHGGRTRVPRTLAILAIYVVIVSAVVLLGLMVVPALVAQAESLWANVPMMFDELQRFLIRHHLMVRRITLQEAVQSAPAGTGGNAMSTVLLAVSGVLGGAFGVVTVLILSFYFLIEAESLFTYVVRFVPDGSRARVNAAARGSVRKVSAWLGAQVLLAGVMGTVAAIGLGLLGEPYFFVVALIAAVGETIPMVGPIIGGVVAVGVASTTSPKLAVEVGLLFLALHQLEANVLVPKIMEKRVGVSPVAVIIALLVGGEIFGLVGAILAVPTAAILAVFIEEFSSHPDALA